MSRRPPRLLRRWLARIVPDGASGPSLLGDLHEEYLAIRRSRGRTRADLWYALQVLSIGVPYAVAAVASRLRTTSSALFGGLALDLAHTLRSLRRSPVTSLVAAGSLTLGIGLATAVVTVLNAVWLAPLPYPDAERLVEIRDTHPVELCRDCWTGTSVRSFREWREELPALEALEASSQRMAVLEHGTTTGDIRVASVSGGWLELLGADTRIGRTIVADDQRGGAAPVVVLGHRLWETRFGSDPGVLGRDVELDGVSHRVVGVLAADVRLPDGSDAWTALGASVAATDYVERGVLVIGRLQHEVDLGAASEVIAVAAAARYAEVSSLEPGWSAEVVPLRSAVSEGALDPTAAAALFAATLLVLLVACMNLAAILLARVADRDHELGVRLALGSGRARILRVAALEALVLALAGGLGALGLAWLGVEAVSRWAADFLPRWMALELDVRVLAAAAGLTLLAASVTGLTPLIRASEARPPGLRERGGGRRFRHQDWLLGAQIVLGVILVGGCVTAVRSFARMADFDTLGHRWENLLSTRVDVPDGMHADAIGHAAWAGEVAGRLEGRPELGDVVPVVPLFLGSWGSEAAASPVRAEGSPEAVANDRVPRHSLAVAPGYFDLFEIPILRGRDLTGERASDGTAAAVASVEAVDALWPGASAEQAIGRTFLIDDGEVEWPFTVVGVAGDVVISPRSESRTVQPRLYLTLGQTPLSLFDRAGVSGVTFQSDLRGAANVPAFEEAILAVDDRVSVAEALTVELALRRWIVEVQVTAALLGGLSALAVALLVIGIHGTLAHRIASTRYDLGVRVALGARRSDLVRAVSLRLVRVFVVALGLGGAVAWASARVTTGAMPLGTEDPVLLLTVALLLLAVGALAGLSPVRKALHVDPLESIRDA